MSQIPHEIGRLLKLHNHEHVRISASAVAKQISHFFGYKQSPILKGYTIFPRLDASARFDAGSSGRNTFETPVKFNVQIDAGHVTHNPLIDAHASNRGNMVHNDKNMDQNYTENCLTNHRTSLKTTF